LFLTRWYMTRPLRIGLIAFVAVLVLSGATLLFLLQDANRFKPRLEALIETQTGVPVRIDGDLQWRLWPPLSLRAEALHAEHEGQTWDIGRLTLNLDLLDLVSAPDRWEVQSVTVNDAMMRQRGNLLEIARASIVDLAPNRPAALHAVLTYTADGQTSVPVRLDGHVRVDPATSDLTLSDTRIDTDMVLGTCNAQAAPAAEPSAALGKEPSAALGEEPSAALGEEPSAALGEEPSAALGEEPSATLGKEPSASERSVIPVAALRAFDWSGDCRLDWLLLDERRFEQVDVRFTNTAGQSVVELEAPQFFGGRALAEVAIDAAVEPVRWTITPTLTNVDSVELLAWLDQRLQWAAPLAYGGTLTLEGNTPAALVASLSGETRFDGGQGHINIAKIRTQLLTLAAMFNEGERVERWPEVWQYQRLVGDWRIDRQQHHIDLALDNLIVNGAGDYDPNTQEIDMLLELVFQNDPQWPVFQVHPMLYDLPIPIRCRGALADPTCRLDSGAAQRIVAQALAGGEDNALRASLEEKIDTQVPAQYRDAARSLLDLLGGSRQDRSDRDRKSRER
jgi:hypothetical protein